MTPKFGLLWDPGCLSRPAGKNAAPVCLVILSCLLPLVIGGAALAQAPTRPQTQVQTQLQPNFRAVSYDVSVSLSPADQTLTGKAIVEFESRSPSNTLLCELNPNLKISAVREASGKSLQFDRDDLSALGVRVFLSDPVGTGQRVKLTFEYSGVLASDENSPIRGVRLAWIGKDGAYLLLPARWFPLTDYPSNRYTGTFRIEVPQGFAVVGTGTSGAPAPVNAPAAPAPALATRTLGGSPSPAVTQAVAQAGPAGPRDVYTFRVDRPEAAGTFVAGALQLFPIQAEGLDVSVYAPPSAAGTTQAHGEAIARIVNEFSDRFGPLAEPNLTLAQIPDGTVASFSAPGLLLLSQRQWLSTPNTRLLSNLVASQWWGNQVMAASPSDAWLTVGLSRYSEALYVEQSASKEGMDKVLEEFAVGSLMYGDVPIAAAGHLEPYTPNYDSVVADKGAMVFHMLRGQMGDSAFFSLLHDFLTRFSDKPATIDDFENLAESHAPVSAAPAQPAAFTLRPDAGPGGASEAPAAAPSDASNGGSMNLRAFFAQWINSTGVPEFTFDYTLYRTKSGFKLVGKLKQNLDFFRMPVEVEIETEGNPEFKTIQVTGMESSFDIDVFGRPRPNGIILDPHNYILKSSARLRVRAIIARGEAFAEQGRYYDAIQQYNQALDIEKTNSLALFRTGEAFFYQRNYSAAANAFRDTLDGNIDPSDKWVEVWSHIYLGKIYDLAGDRPRAVNEYGKAEQTNDNTGGAQDEAKKYTAQAYSDAPAASATSATSATK